MAYTYSKIATYTVGSGGIASIDFLNIPQTYTDLVIKYSIRTTSANQVDYMKCEFNGSTTSYSERVLFGYGTTTGSATNSGSYDNIINGGANTASTFSNGEIYIPNYTGANYKSFSSDSVAESNSTTNNMLMLAAELWSNTSPITSIKLSDYSSGTFAQYSTAHLYGIKAEL